MVVGPNLPMPSLSPSSQTTLLPQPKGVFRPLPVHRDGSQSKAASIHGEVDEEVDSLADEGAEDPALKGVDGGLERHAEDNEEEVSQAEVQDEEVGSVVAHLPIAQQHCQHQAIAHCAQEEDEGEDDGDNDAGRAELVAVGGVPVPSQACEVLVLRHSVLW